MDHLHFMNTPPPHTEIGRVLLPIARASIAQQLGTPHAADESASWLRAQGASFITLTLQNKLRGCIGTLRAHRPLLDDVKANAVAAAFRDPRFKPLTVQEYETIAVEISLLSSVTPLTFTDQPSALAQIKPHEHGVIFEYGHHRSTYLPQVWDSIPDLAMFMATLKQKAGLPPDFWEPGVKLATYTVAKFKESELSQA